MISLSKLISQVSSSRGGQSLTGKESLGYDVHTFGPSGNELEAFTFPHRKLAEIAASKITWIKGGQVERANDGKKIRVRVDRE